jgi:hypothetical protein
LLLLLPPAKVKLMFTLALGLVANDDNAVGTPALRADLRGVGEPTVVVELVGISFVADGNFGGVMALIGDFLSFALETEATGSNLGFLAIFKSSTESLLRLRSMACDGRGCEALMGRFDVFAEATGSAGDVEGTGRGD